MEAREDLEGQLERARRFREARAQELASRKPRQDDRPDLSAEWGKHGRWGGCKCCDHPQATEIDRALLERVPYRDISKRFGVSIMTISRHANLHLKPALEEAKKIFTEQKQVAYQNRVKTALDTLHVLDTIIQTLPEKLPNATVRDILAALKVRSELLGEEFARPIVVRWGLGLEEEAKNDAGEGEGASTGGSQG